MDRAVVQSDLSALAAPAFEPADGVLHPVLVVAIGEILMRMRATASAILLFVVNMIGAGLGPLAIGFLNDYVFGPIYGDEAIRYSILVIGLVGGLASILFWQASKSLNADLARRDID